MNDLDRVADWLALMGFPFDWANDDATAAPRCLLRPVAEAHRRAELQAQGDAVTTADMLTEVEEAAEWTPSVPA